MSSFENRTTAMEGIILYLKSINEKCFKCQYYLPFFEKGLPLEAVIIISKLLDWEGKQADKHNFYIYKTIKEMTKETGLSRYRQDRGIKILKFCKLVDVVNKGMPRKRHFMLNFEALMGFVVGDSKLIKKNSFNLFKKIKSI